MLGDATYPLQTYLTKQFKDRCDLNKMRFDNSMNCGHVFIVNVFGSLKNWWRILNFFDCRVDKGGKIIMACCVFHNFCQLMNMLELVMCDIWQRRDPLVGFHGQHVFAN